MNLTDTVIIPVPRIKVWEALNETEILRQCIPGCEEIRKNSDTEMEAKVTVKMGPVKATFTGKVTFSDMDPPNGYRISGDGKSIMGGAKGGADVKLEEVDGGTRLTYNVDALVTGKIASLAQRFIEPTARQLSGQFFEKFAEIVTNEGST
ncbi:carbon monoxide dehydrogenase subunit G [Gemmobacter fulvus]|uniref:CoxG family protein n=1 Tax=Gemmobacter fulvus TaxID=2840474 RepID=UPI002796C6F5|nr:carbon monoxide dehydrogenase subunit G [Gemmobacter fulvus]MDQ1850674.1 carbon monoxide dehydrogenase subunit G [Gemmobacter fulvus]